MIATKLSMRKIGKMISVEVISRFALPSGDEAALTAREGKKKRKELEGLLLSAAKAFAEISGLHSYLKNLRSELLEWQNMRTTRRFGGADVPDAGLINAKGKGIARTRP